MTYSSSDFQYSMRTRDETPASLDRKFGGICKGRAMMAYSGLVEKGLGWALQVSDGSFRMGTSSVFGQQSSAQID